MGTGLLILLVAISIVFIINNAAGDFVRIDNQRRHQQYINDIYEQARLKREREEIDFHAAQMRKAMKDLDKSIISDAEIVEERKEISNKRSNNV